MEFLVYMEVTEIRATAEDEAALRSAEAARAGELAAEGILIRLWRVPGKRANWGIWQARDATQLHLALVSLPLFPYLSIAVHPLAAHPNDPGRQPQQLPA